VKPARTSARKRDRPSGGHERLGERVKANDGRLDLRARVERTGRDQADQADRRDRLDGYGQVRKCPVAGRDALGDLALDHHHDHAGAGRMSR
jgi:hypothetical protein